VLRSAVENWSEISPEAAWRWAKSNIGAIGEDHSSLALHRWAQRDPLGAQNVLHELQGPQRRIAVETIARALAEADFEGGLEWARSLPDAEERRAAEFNLNQNRLTGVGAMLGMENGLPVVRGLVEGGPLQARGIQEGDRIVEIQGSDNVTLYGKDLEEVVKLLRGVPGSQVSLRIHRYKDGQIDELWQHHVQRQPLQTRRQAR
jgi:C-terminal processing protease CtpA/Prc